MTLLGPPSLPLPGLSPGDDTPMSLELRDLWINPSISPIPTLQSVLFPWPENFQVKNPEMPPSVSTNKSFLSILPGPLNSLLPISAHPKTLLFHFEISSTFSTTLHALSQTPWLDCTDPWPHLGALLSPFLIAQGVYIPSGLIGRFLWSLSLLSHPKILSPPSCNPHPEALWLEWPLLV